MNGAARRGAVRRRRSRHALPPEAQRRRSARASRGIVRGPRREGDRGAARGRRGDDPAAAIHSARKDIKKIRSVLRLLRDELGEKTYGAENERYRDAGRTLSGSRDAEVKVETLDGAGGALRARDAERLGLGLERPAGARAPRGDRRRRDAAAIEAAVEALEAGREAAAERSLDRLLEALRPRPEAGYKGGRKAMAKVAADPDPELVHEWRKRTKDLWYDLRLIRRAWPELLAPTVERARARRPARRPPRPHRSRRGPGVAPEGRQQGEDGGADRAAPGGAARRALDLGARLYAEKPKAFGTRLHAYWAAWR